jgi:polyhydroxybutyrate depolymerase
MFLRQAACAGVFLCGVVACSSSDAPSGGSSGGAAGKAGASGGAGGGSSGATSSAGTAGTSVGPTGGGGMGPTAGAGGTSSGGTGGAIATGGSAGSTGGSRPAVPSAGCGKSGRPTGGEVATADHIYDFPATYDGHTPMPMLMGFHANNNPVNQLRNLTNGSKLETNFVRVFPKSAGAGWVIGTDAANVTTIFNDVLANYCVDTSRVFATGHSSGAQMVVQLLCAQGGELRFKGVAPVAASKYCSMVSPIPVMYIQGMMDAMRGGGNGIDVVNFFAGSNGCSSMPAVPDIAVTTCKSTFDQMDVTPGCVTYQGCSKPTIWCSHNDNGYNSTDGHEHGWPCFASSAMADFFLSL